MMNVEVSRIDGSNSRVDKEKRRRKKGCLSFDGDDLLLEPTLLPQTFRPQGIKNYRPSEL